MFYLKAIAGIIGFIAFLNLLAFILDLLFQTEVGATVTILALFVGGMVALIKAVFYVADKIEGKN